MVAPVLEALAAIHGAVIVRLEGNLARLAAVGAHSVKHLAAATLPTACLAGRTAVTASLGLVLKALLGVKLLLAGSKHEFPSAVLADQSLVSVHVIPQFFLCISCTYMSIIQPSDRFVNPYSENFVKYL